MLSTASDGWCFFFLTCSPILDICHFSQVILPIVLLIKNQPSGAVDSTWWLGLIFFDLFSHSGLRAFFTSDFANCTTDYAPTIRCCSQHLMVGVFFLPVLPFWTEGIFHRWFCQLYYSLCPTIRCCSQHLMVGLFFFYLFSCSGLRAFCTNDFANCTTNHASPQNITPTISCCEQHLMVGVNFFLTYSQILDLGHFSQVILPIVLQFMPNHQVLFTASDGWG